MSEPHIGTLNESPLHADLKSLIAEPGDQSEHRVGRFVVDILRGNLVVEIQTANFASIRRKISRLLDDYQVRLIHPIAHERWILKPAAIKKSKATKNRATEPVDGDYTRRKSPKRQGLEACFWELVSIPHLLRHDGFELELVLIQEEEIRVPENKRYYRSKPYRVQERRLVSVIDRMVIKAPRDLLRLFPIALSDPFTTRDLADLTGWPIHVARRGAYVLRETGVTKQCGKKGNAIVYVLGRD